MTNKSYVEELINDALQAINQLQWHAVGTAAIYFFVGLILAQFSSRAIAKILVKHTSAHYTMIIRRVIFYSIAIIAFILTITTLQLDIKVLGIATALTVALGLASQSAISNIISGLFFVFERPFSIGDYITIDDLSGEILTIDLLSIKLRTFQNTLIRIPNETLLKSKLINNTKFPIRRLDVPLRIPLDADVEEIKKVMFAVAAKNAMCLQSPAPDLLFDSFTSSAIKIYLAVWVKTSFYYTLRGIIPFELQAAFKQHGIPLPVEQHQVSINEALTKK